MSRVNGHGMEMEENWRQEVDAKLKRLHSLLFGAEVALQAQDPETALGLALRLQGFLDSQSHATVAPDETFINPIRKNVHNKIAAARQLLAPRNDRYGH